MTTPSPTGRETMDEVLAYLAVELLGWEWSECESTETDHVHGPNCPYSWTFKGDGSTNSYEIGLGYLLTGNGMLEIIEAMRARGFTPVIQGGGPNTGLPRAFFAGINMAQPGSEAVTYPEAVACAAYAALRESK